MKMKFIVITAAIAMSHSALAQTSSTTAPAAPAAAANTNVASDATAAQAKGPQLGVKYLGVMYGPSADFSGTHTTESFAASAGQDMFIDNRPKLVVKMNPNLDLSLEARVNTFFIGHDEGMTAKNGNYRLGASFKNVYKDSLNTVSLIPRIVLPTSANAHDRDMKPSPELLINIDTAPANSRFSFNTGVQYIQYIYGRQASAKDQQKPVTAVLAPWAEVDYQLTSKAQINLSYWPEMVASARKGTPLATDSNEIDLGVTYEIAKGWNLSPFVAAQMNDLNNPDKPDMSLDKAMNVNLAITGAFL